MQSEAMALHVEVKTAFSFSVIYFTRTDKVFFLSWIVTFPQVVDFESRHFLGEDGLGEVKQRRVINRKVAVVLIENPRCGPLNAALHNKEEESLLKQTQGCYQRQQP